VVWTYSVGSQIGRAIKYPREFTGVSENGEVRMTNDELRMRAGPNPFRNSARVRWTLGAAGTVKLTVHDAAGRLVATLADGRFDAGSHEARLDPGAAMPAGVYFCRLVTATAGERRVETLALVKE
ncbi:T9SS type A sorting domain-containing protein, partial [candidate division WOR-3 bacterium]|nr:T9SS type A sorting domain-containing protein [candidate division WOR-3 bacterium]